MQNNSAILSVICLGGMAINGVPECPKLLKALRPMRLFTSLRDSFLEWSLSWLFKLVLWCSVVVGTRGGTIGRKTNVFAYMRVWLPRCSWSPFSSAVWWAAAWHGRWSPLEEQVSQQLAMHAIKFQPGRNVGAKFRHNTDKSTWGWMLIGGTST